MFPQFTFYITILQTCRIYIWKWKALSILSLFQSQHTLAMVQKNMDQVVSTGMQGYLYYCDLCPLHCCEDHIKAQAPYRACAAVLCPVRREWDECLYVNCQQTSYMKAWNMEQKILLSLSRKKLARAQVSPNPMLWGLSGLWHEGLWE